VCTKYDNSCSRFCKHCDCRVLCVVRNDSYNEWCWTNISTTMRVVCVPIKVPEWHSAWLAKCQMYWKLLPYSMTYGGCMCYFILLTIAWLLTKMRTRKATRHKRVENDTPAWPPNLLIVDLWPWTLTSWPQSWSFDAFPCGPLVPVGIKIRSFVFKILYSQVC